MSTTAKKINWIRYSIFFEKHKITFDNYQKYGQIVLDKDLAEDLDGENSEFIEIFTESKTLGDFEYKMKEYWIKHHQIVMEKLSDIAKIYDMYGNTVDISKADRRFRKDYLVPVLIFDELFEYIQTHQTSLRCNNYSSTLIKHDNYIYEIDITSSTSLHIRGRHKVEDVFLSVPE